MVERYLKKIESCDTLIKQNANNGEVYLERARAYLCLSNYLEARKDCDKAIEFCTKDESLVSAYVYRGFAKTTLGEYASAREDYNEAIKRSHNNNSSAFCFRGELNRIEMQDEVAINDFEEAIKINRENLQAHLFLGNMRLLRREWEKAETEFNQIVKGKKDASEDDEFACMMRAMAWIGFAALKRRPPRLEEEEANDCDRKACNEIIKARKLNPDNIYIAEAEAYIYYKLKEYNKGLEIISSMLQKHNKFINGYVLRAKIYDALRAENDLQTLRQLPGYERTQEENFMRQGSFIVLKNSNHSNDADKIKILSNKENLKHISFLKRENGWEKSHIQCYWKEYVENAPAIAFDVFSLKENKLVGIAWLYNIDLKEREVEFGIIIDSHSARNGYSTECHLLCMRYCFNELNFDKIKFCTSSNNEAMVNFYQKVCGLDHPEGVENLTYCLSKEGFVNVEKRITQKITTKSQQSNVSYAAQQTFMPPPPKTSPIQQFDNTNIPDVKKGDQEDKDYQT